MKNYYFSFDDWRLHSEEIKIKKNKTEEKSVKNFKIETNIILWTLPIWLTICLWGIATNLDQRIDEKYSAGEKIGYANGIKQVKFINSTSEKIGYADEIRQVEFIIKKEIMPSAFKGQTTQ